MCHYQIGTTHKQKIVLDRRIYKITTYDMFKTHGKTCDSIMHLRFTLKFTHTHSIPEDDLSAYDCDKFKKGPWSDEMLQKRHCQKKKVRDDEYK